MSTPGRPRRLLLRVQQLARLVDVTLPDRGVILTMEDITESKAAELELTRSNAELKQFASVVSHDLRQPLSMVRGYLGLIEKRMGADLADDIKTYLQHASAGAKHMDRLIFDVLEYSRTGNTVDFVPTSLNEAVADALRCLHREIREADADISVADTMPLIMGDRTELMRLFENLIGNALKYRSPDRLPQVEIGYREQGRDYLIWVRDNGMGIAPEDHEKAFRIFQRLVPDDAIKGSGVGLAICKKIVEHHGGKTWIESSLGQGCAVMMTFPVIPRNSAATASGLGDGAISAFDRHAHSERQMAQ